MEQLQQRLPGWNPDRPCHLAHHYQSKYCEYDEQGRLIKLHFCNLKLAHIPSEVWQFSALQELSLTNNQLSILPAEVGNLIFLEHLDLSGNQLSILPAEVGNLKFLQRLLLGNNPLQSPPPAIIKQDIPAVLAYLAMR